MASGFEKLLRKGERRRRWSPKLPKQPWALFALPAIAIIVILIFMSEYLVSSSARTSESHSERPRVINGGNAWGGNDETNNQNTNQALGAISGRVEHVRAGDAIEVGGIATRLEKLDCAEKRSVAGNAATAKMRQLVVDRTLICRLDNKPSCD